MEGLILWRILFGFLGEFWSVIMVIVRWSHEDVWSI
jgi:hypothetical protein